MIKIFRKEGWTLNPKDSIINNIIKMIESNNGECPCANESEEGKCPCSDYRIKDICHCGLYVKPNELDKLSKESSTKSQ
ncbi:MAG: hypothetical protein IJU02_07305 [Lachnospiraceae bacterium]|nr:hypothetical protein [Lachnospiraceae bacterium]